MITYLKGKTIYIKEEDRYQLVDVLLSNGIGYQVVTGKMGRFEVGQEIVFHTHLVVREDSQTLFGFKSVEERDLFEMLITVSGVGPKTAISIMSFYSPVELYELILAEDHKTLGKVPGLGSKSSQKIILDLKSKVEGLGFILGDGASRSEKDSVLREFGEAMKALGFVGEQNKQYMEKAKMMIKDKDYVVEDLIKLVLQGN